MKNKLTLFLFLILALGIKILAQPAPTTLNYGNVFVGSTQTLTTTITNITVADRVYTAVLPSGFSASPSFPITILNGGADVVVTITFSPILTLVYSTTFDIVDDQGVPITTTMTVNGVGVTAPTFSASSLAFGEAFVTGQTVSLSLNITNNSATILEYTVTLPSGSYTGLSNTSSPNIAIGATQNNSVIFNPSAVGADNGNILLSFNDGTATGTFTIPVTGTGIADPDFTASPINFNDAFIGQTKSATLTCNNNSSTAAVSFSQAGISSPFSTSTGNPVSVGISSLGTFSLAYLPITIVGTPHSNILTINYTTVGGGSSSANVTLSGNAIALPTFSVASLAFGDVFLTNPKTLTFTITNNSAASSVTFTPTFPSARYTESPAPSATISPLAVSTASTYSLRFLPTSDADDNGNLTFNYTAGTGAALSEVISVTGHGVALPSFVPTTYTYPDVFVNLTNSHDFSIQNNSGSRDLTVAVSYPGGFSGGTPISIPASTTVANHSITFGPTNPVLYSGNAVFSIATISGTTQTITQNVTLQGLGLPVPVLSVPANTLTGVTILPTFTWSTVPGATNYILEIAATSGGFGSLLWSIDLTGGTLATTYLLKETDYVLSNNTTYYWRVKGTIPSGTGISNVWSFKTTPSSIATLSHPLNGTTVDTYDPVIFTWFLNTAVGTLTFDRQYIKAADLDGGIASTPTAADWADVATTTDNCNSNVSDNTETLISGTKYWWRVITKRSTEVVSYSAAQSFTTGGGATVATAVPSWPTGGAGTKVYTNTPTFSWYTHFGALTDISFELLVDQHSAHLGVGSEDVKIINISDLSYTLNGLGTEKLLPGTLYYWKVKTYYKKGTADEQSTLSSSASFTTNGVGTVLTPILSYPTGDITVYTEAPKLFWYVGGASDGLTYEVTINGHTYTTSNLYLDLATVAPSAGLTGGGTYSWTVKAINTDLVNLTSNPASFKVAGGIAEGKPVASWPVGGATIYTTEPTFSWYVSGSTIGITGYKIGFSTASAGVADTKADAAAGTDIHENTDASYHYADYGSKVFADVNARSFDYALEPLSYSLGYGKTYYWTILSYSAAGNSTVSPSSRGSFTVAGIAGSIVPIASDPKGGVTIYSTSATLSWYVNGPTDAINLYQVIWSRRSDFNGDVAEAGTTFIQTTTDQFKLVNTLTPGATYYWKVASHNGTALSAYSTTASFVVAPTANATVIVPLVGGPSNSVSIATTAPMLSWIIPTQATAPLNYELQYSKQQDMSSATTVSGINSPSQIVSGLSASQEYYWRVRSMNEKGEASAFSEVGRFVVNATTAVEDKEVIPTAFALSQNYPNPFNPTTQITYALPKNSYVSIVVYDMLGREVKTLLNNEVLAGNHSVTWNGDDNNGMKVVSGVYLYKINAGDFVKTMKLILMK